MITTQNEGGQESCPNETDIQNSIDNCSCEVSSKLHEEISLALLDHEK